MIFSISTRWNAARHESARAMVDEILDLGINQLELGYNLRSNMVVDIKAMVGSKLITVGSVHNYCPVPKIAAEGHPELFTLSSTDQATREAAIEHTSNTIRFAADLGAEIVVIHCGNVEMDAVTPRLVDMSRGGKRVSNAYERTKHTLFERRRKKVNNQLFHLYRGFESLLPLLEKSGVRLGIENLPTWEAIPTELECMQLIREFGDDHLCYWHDIGHAQIRENLGFINHENSLSDLSGMLGGMHIHDVLSPVTDHLMPPMGNVDFRRLKKYACLNIIRVLEPSSRLTFEEINRGLKIIRAQWENDHASELCSSET